MNLNIMRKDTIELLAHQYDVGAYGRACRKELRRRKNIGFWLGPIVSPVKVKEERTPVSTVGQVRIVRK